LIFGGYPSVVAETSKNKKIDLLTEIVESYLLKDVLEFEKVKRSKTIFNLLKLLAFQIGSEVSLSELAQDLGTDHKTVGRYIDILEQSFIIFPLTGFNRNLRSEINKKNKYYFYDNGIRNAIISNFNDLSLRDDIGQLWENFLFMERLKKREYNRIYANAYFWRTWEKQEIDLIEEEGGKLHAYEFKWKKDKVKVPSKWSETYKDSTFEVITKDNYLDFVL
jgi:predicted AAA+ superfamily ATPase